MGEGDDRRVEIDGESAGDELIEFLAGSISECECCRVESIGRHGLSVPVDKRDIGRSLLSCALYAGREGEIVFGFESVLQAGQTLVEHLEVRGASQRHEHIVLVVRHESLAEHIHVILVG